MAEVDPAGLEDRGHWIHSQQESHPCSVRLRIGPVRDLAVWKASKGAKGLQLLGKAAQVVVGLRSPLGPTPQTTFS